MRTRLRQVLCDVLGYTWAMAAKKTKVQKVMHEFKTGSLHSGKGGPVVKSKKQAVAIALSEAARAKRKK